MSTVLEAAPPTQAQKRLTPVQYVDALPIEDQEDIPIHLLKLLRKENDGAAVIPVETADEKLGYFITPDGMQAYFDADGGRSAGVAPPHGEPRPLAHDGAAAGRA